MNLANVILDQLKAEQQKFAVEALKRPHDKTEFEYGHRVGIMAGLEAAIEVLINLLNEEKNGNL